MLISFLLPWQRDLGSFPHILEPFEGIQFPFLEVNEKIWLIHALCSVNAQLELCGYKLNAF